MSDLNPPDIESEATKHLYVLTKLTEVYLAADAFYLASIGEIETNWTEFGTLVERLGEALGYAPSDD